MQPRRSNRRVDCDCGYAIFVSEGTANRRRDLKEILPAAFARLPESIRLQDSENEAVTSPGPVAAQAGHQIGEIQWIWSGH
jgi:hypothetical protein